MTSVETELEKCTKCNKQINGDRTICQCYRADMPKGDLDKMINNSYIECFTICPDCASKMQSSNESNDNINIILLPDLKQQYMVDKMIDIHIREREVHTNPAIDRIIDDIGNMRALSDDQIEGLVQRPLPDLMRIILIMNRTLKMMIEYINITISQDTK